MRKRPSLSVAALSPSQLAVRSPSVSASASAAEAEIEEAGLEVEVGEFLEVVADRGTDGQDGQAALGIEAVLLEVLLDQDLEHGVPGRVERSAVEQDLAHRLGLVGDPGVEGGQEGLAVDEVVLECQQAEQQALGRGGGWFARRLGGMRLDAENGVDGGAVVGEPLAVLLRKRRLAGALAELALDPEQLLEQNGAPGLGPAGQEVLDARPVAAPLPVGLEAIGRLVDPGPLASVGVAHSDLRDRSQPDPMRQFPRALPWAFLFTALSGRRPKRTTSIVADSPVSPDSLQLALDRSERAFQLLGDLGVGVALELPEGDLA